MNFEKLRPDKYLKYLYLPNLFAPKRTKEILVVNPTVHSRVEAEEVVVTVYDYNAETLEERKDIPLEQCFTYRTSGRTTWINIDGLRKSQVESVCSHYGIHPLIVEDILSINQRPKIDEADTYIYCLLNMLYFDPKDLAVEHEQISIILGKEVVISFQEDAKRDVFNSLRDKLKLPNSKIRQRGADYLCYSLLDHIVDHYFVVMEKL